MTLSGIDRYFILLNAAAFLLFGLDAFLRSRQKSGLPSVFCLIFAAAGGSIGALLAELLWDRVPLRGADTAKAKQRRDAALSRQILSGLFVILHLFVYLVLTKRLRLGAWHLPTLTPGGITFLKWAGILLPIINLAAFLLFGIDKQLAKRGKRRISIRVLFIFALCGGSLGALCGMWGFRHKTRKPYFRYGLPLLLFLQLAAAVILLPLLEKLP